MKQISGKEMVAIGLMLFALFFGAGNLIFPPALGQAAGTSLWVAMVGFLITGVGLPLLSVAAVGMAGGSLQALANRVHPVFGIVFTIVVYLAIGPLFGIPRTGTVAFEMGASPFLPEEIRLQPSALFLYSVVFFGITFWFSIHPSKLVDRIGKVLTPLLLGTIALLVIKSFISPIGELGNPEPAYQEAPFFKGFIEGYLTMDTIAALVFSMVVISAIEERGIKDHKVLAATTLKAGMIAGVGLALVYLSLSFLGGSSSEILGVSENGGEILSNVAYLLFGSSGTMLLGLAVTLACLTTSVGLVAACGRFFAKIFPAVSYKIIISILTLFSALLANIGLTQIIKLSVPVLIGIYPLAIVLVLLSFFHHRFKGHAEVYQGALIATIFVSLVDSLSQAGLRLETITSIYQQYLPLYVVGIGWVIPAFGGAVLGYLVARLKRKEGKAERDPEEKVG
ncbi:branched-chain amino acid transport system II carrier protein [Ammoniphilus sp. YIM 78166]|uniref:branched-chain amino acid transport system II carrier protein n=1 Tax=Ammoniphilus sp. YIM 78166 TaxID=1644106 RepID=UPI0010705C6C|nr:branched-chain amino acid transport system II carrier protein [Ammoniphilus sp. YIM 78166]